MKQPIAPIIRARAAWLMPALLIVLLASAVVCVGVGSVPIDARTVVRVMLHAAGLGGGEITWPQATAHILLDLRLPRILLGMIAGAGLAMVGAVLQTITRNALADPYLFGVSSGASVGAVTVLLYIGPVIGAVTLPVVAFAGALLSIALVFVLARESGGFTRDRMVLTGVAVHFVFMAITNGLVINAPDRGADSALFWMLGGFSNARWALIAPAALALVGVGGWILLRAPQLDALSLGDEGAHTLGIEVKRLRVEMFIGCAILTGVLVAGCGAVGFIGLVVPHCARWLVGARLGVSTVVGAVMGAIFAIWMDAAARTMFAPKELPLGVMTAAVGGLFLIFILRRTRRV